MVSEKTLTKPVLRRSDRSKPEKEVKETPEILYFEEDFVLSDSESFDNSNFIGIEEPGIKGVNIKITIFYLFIKKYNLFNKLINIFRWCCQYGNWEFGKRSFSYFKN